MLSQRTFINAFGNVISESRKCGFPLFQNRALFFCESFALQDDFSCSQLADEDGFMDHPVQEPVSHLVDDIHKGLGIGEFGIDDDFHRTFLQSDWF